MSSRPRAVIVVTGSELVRGDRRDANGPFLAAELVRLGIEPAQILLVGDDEDELAAAIGEALDADICITSGGLGPTHDDRTIELIARESGRPLRLDGELELEIASFSRKVAERLGRPYADFAAGVKKQASMPEGAVSLGLAGTAPGVLLERDGRVAVALPGPPGELRRLWPRAVESEPFRRILARVPALERRVLRFFGPSESQVARALTEAGGESEGVVVTVCAREFEIHVDVFVEAGGKEHAGVLESALRKEFADQLFAEDEQPVEGLILDLARRRGVTIATAESCTGGLVGSRLTAVPGASDVYLGGVVAYSNSLKQRQLRVPDELLARCGAVSAEVAAAMAKGATAALGADVAVAVTGVAGPGGGSEDKPVGLVHVHVEAPWESDAFRIVLPGDRDAIRQRGVAFALHRLRRVLSRSGDGRV